MTQEQKLVDALMRQAQLAKTEHGEQVAVIEWAQLHESQYPYLYLLHAIPNGGARHIATARRLKVEGVKRGCPDLHLPLAHGDYIGLWIEMKRPGGKVSPEQEKWITDLRALGHRAVVCYGADEAILELERYCKLSAPDRAPTQTIFERLADNPRIVAAEARAAEDEDRNLRDGVK